MGSKEHGLPPGDDLDPDTRLMLGFQSGDEACFEELVRRFQGRVVSLANRYLGSAADAEDLAQEVFLRVFRAKERYEPSAKFSTWLYRITANASLNAIRGRKVRARVAGEMPTGVDDGPGEFADPDARSPLAQVEDDELKTVLRGIVDTLPDRQRLAILLNKYEGLSYEETAAALELSLPATKSLLTRARVGIKDEIARYIATGQAPPGGGAEDE